MFTFADICNIAIQIEKNGEATYRCAADAVRNTEMAAILIWMADQEKHHAQWFESIKSTGSKTHEQEEIEEMGKSLLQEMIKGNDFLLGRNDLEHAGSVADILARSKTFEKDTILFYEFLLGLVEDEESTKKMKRIIEEEKNHIRELERLEKSNAPAGANAQ